MGERATLEPEAEQHPPEHEDPSPLRRAADAARRTFASSRRADDPADQDAADPYERSLRSLEGRLVPDPRGGARRPAPRDVPEDVQLRTAVHHILRTQGAALGCIKDGVRDAIDRIEEPEVVPSDLITPLLIAAAATLCGGFAGTATVWIGAAVASSAAKSVVSGAVKSALSSAAKTLTPKVSTAGVREAFKQHLRAIVANAQQEILNGSYDLELHLNAFGLDEVQKLRTTVTEATMLDQIIAKAESQTLVAWTNFLARAKHGAGTWDHWAPHGGKGALKLQGADDPAQQPSQTLGASNIDSEAQSGLLGPKQPNALPEHYGILEIFMHNTGELIQQPGFGMRLDNVGPKVREHLRTLGTVRDLAVNKIVRVVSIPYRPEAPRMIRNSILITADGYVRRYDLGGDTQVQASNAVRRAPEAGGVIEPLRRGIVEPLMRGRAPIQGDTDANEQVVTEIAERAQSLPLTLLTP